ncbi:hypothetical protein ACFL6C_07205 [Myxococcota bacterium]
MIIVVALALAINACTAEKHLPYHGTIRGDSDGTGGDSPTGDTLRGDTHVVYCPDGPSDEPICGTMLEDLGLEWSDGLVLCNRWTENASLDWETSHKVRVTIPAQSRTSLHRGAMEQWRIADITIERGPLAAEQWHPSPTRATVVDYQLTSADDFIQLHAQLEYDLGDAGTLQELVTVYRRPENPSPFVYSADQETFWYQAVDWETAVPVVTCQGQHETEPDAAQVLVAERQGRRLSIARFGIVHWDGMSLSWIPEAAVVRLDDTSWVIFVARGYWTQVFSAMHHGFGEQALVDFGRDPVVYYLLQHPDLRWPSMGPMPTQIRISAAGVDVDWIDNEGTASQETWSLLPPGNPEIFDSFWSRVDGGWRLRSMASCDEPEMWLLQEDAGPYVPIHPAFAFNALVCLQESSPGFSLEALIPITFQPDFSEIGTVREEIVSFAESGRTGYRVVVGASFVEVARLDGQANEQINVRVLDAGGAETTSFSSDPGESLSADLAVDERLCGKNELQGVDAQLVRRWISVGEGRSALYAPLSFQLTLGEETLLVDGWDRLDYSNTHHNWQDRLEATTDNLRLIWQQDGPAHRHVRVETLDGVETLGQTTLEDWGCVP